MKTIFAFLFALAIAAQAAVLNDTFTGAAGALSAHTPETGTWTNVDSALALDGSGQLANTGTGSALATVATAPGSADVQAVMVANRDNNSHYAHRYLYLRWDEADSKGYVLDYQGDNLRLLIFRSGGVLDINHFTSLSGPAAATGSHTVRVDVSGPTNNVDFVIRIDGTIVDSYNDHFGTTIDAPGVFKLGIDLGGDGSLSSSAKVDAITFDVANPNLTTGAANTTTATNSVVHLTAAAATGGSGSYTYRWHRSTIYGFTPATGTALTALGSHLNYDDTSATAGTIYYYVLETNDGTDTVYSAQVAGRLWKAKLVVGFLGDSITGGYAGAGNPLAPPGDLVATFYREFDGERIFTAVNQGVGGSTTATWQPGGANMLAADAAFAAAGVTHVMVCLGTNDALDASLDAATYQTNLAAICAHLVAAGYKVIVSYPTGTLPSTSGYTTAMYDRLQSYLPAVAAVCNGSTIILGDTEMRFRLLEEPALWLSSDGVHLYTATYSILARFMAGALYRALNPAGGGGGGSSGFIGSGFFGF